MKLGTKSAATALSKTNLKEVDIWLQELGVNLNHFGLMRLIADALDMQARDREVQVNFRVTKKGDGFAVYVNSKEGDLALYGTDFFELNEKASEAVEAPETPQEALPPPIRPTTKG